MTDTVQRKVLAAAFAYTDEDAPHPPGTPAPTRYGVTGEVISLAADRATWGQELGLLGDVDGTQETPEPQRAPAHLLGLAEDATDEEVLDRISQATASPETPPAATSLEDPGPGATSTVPASPAPGAEAVPPGGDAVPPASGADSVPSASDATTLTAETLATMSVGRVRDHLETHPGDVTVVRDLEVAGRNRRGVLDLTG